LFYSYQLFSTNVRKFIRTATWIYFQEENLSEIFGIFENHTYICIVLWLCLHLKRTSNCKNVTKDKPEKDSGNLIQERDFYFSIPFFLLESFSFVKIINQFYTAMPDCKRFFMKKKSFFLLCFKKYDGCLCERWQLSL